MADVLIVGGGVIGLSLAWELAGQGTTVAVVEQGEFGREASWAGAGILPPGNVSRAATPEARLRSFSGSLWDDWSARLREETGLDNGYRACGGVTITRRGEPERLRLERRHWEQEGVAARWLSEDERRNLVPALHPETAAAFELPELCQVRNPRHLKALLAACATRGVQLIAGTPVVDFISQGNRVAGVRTIHGELSAGTVCVTSGAWTRNVLASVGVDVRIEPVRGQIALLSMTAPPFKQVIEEGPRYLVPRGDGRVLVGATEERVGFDKRNTASAVAGLIEFAIDLVPCLTNAHVERTWSGLRPGSPDGLPYLGRVPGFDHLTIAAGHFRSGLQMSPGTAVLLRQLILGQGTAIPLEPYAIRPLNV